MQYFETWKQAVTASLQGLLLKVTDFLPNFIAALLVLIIGVIVAASLAKLIKKLVELTRVDKLLDKLGVNDAFKAFGKISVGGIIGWLVKWFLIVVVLMAVADILQMSQINEFLKQVAGFLPNVVIAVVVMMIGFVGGNFVYEIVYRSVKATKMHSPRFLANIAKWSIIIFALMASLIQLSIAAALVQTLFTGFIAMMAIAGGIAFGLGGKEKASDWLDSLEKKL
ncbi:MAG: hypothetical protein NTZ25_00275 [Candidatus Peregrinibacteria bacterium]|nr:hypothetical protein [Candidatus Peregrinibacteria bacterium]